jgi:hypothetical protein
MSGVWGFSRSNQITDTMKLTNIVAIIMTMVTTKVCASLGLQVRDGDTPLVKLYFGKILLLSLPLSCQLLIGSDEDGKEVYSNNFAFDDRCNSKLVGYGGIWINKDTRPAADRQGCAYASTNDACGDDMDWDAISLTFSGELSS